MSRHAAVWIDHKEARVFAIHPENADETTVMAPLHNVHHKHPPGPGGAKEHPEDAKRFFHEVGRALDGCEQVLVVGPGAAKLEFLRYVHKHEHALESKIVGIETVDHPTDRQLVAFARTYFKASDRMR